MLQYIPQPVHFRFGRSFNLNASSQCLRTIYVVYLFLLLSANVWTVNVLFSSSSPYQFVFFRRIRIEITIECRWDWKCERHFLDKLSFLSLFGSVPNTSMSMRICCNLKNYLYWLLLINNLLTIRLCSLVRTSTLTHNTEIRQVLHQQQRKCLLCSTFRCCTV